MQYIICKWKIYLAFAKESVKGIQRGTHSKHNMVTSDPDRDDQGAPDPETRAVRSGTASGERAERSGAFRERREKPADEGRTHAARSFQTDLAERVGMPADHRTHRGGAHNPSLKLCGHLQERAGRHVERPVLGRTPHREQSSRRRRTPRCNDTTLEQGGSVAQKSSIAGTSSAGPGRAPDGRGEPLRRGRLHHSHHRLGPVPVLRHHAEPGGGDDRTPLLTPLGRVGLPVITPPCSSSFSPQASSPTYLQVRSGTNSTPIRASAQSDHIPWDCVAPHLASVRPRAGRNDDGHAHSRRKCRSSASGSVTWGGDIAIGIVYFTLAFFLAFGLFCRHLPQRHRPPSPAGARAGGIAGSTLQRAHTRQRPHHAPGA